MTMKGELELKEPVLVLELMMMKGKHTVQFLERDFRKKFALTAPLTPPTRAEGVLKLMMMKEELQMSAVLPALAAPQAEVGHLTIYYKLQ
jgi:hypothetical protein